MSDSINRLSKELSSFFAPVNFTINENGSGLNVYVSILGKSLEMNVTDPDIIKNRDLLTQEIIKCVFESFNVRVQEFH